MILPIYTYGEYILRKPAIVVRLDLETLPTLIDDMFETMHNANGAGLAAPQIGESIRLIVIEEKLEEDELFKMALINPNILSYSGEEKVMIEGCLSVPGITAYVKRPDIIKLEWFDENKKYNKALFSGLKSRIIQHEMDHLNGTLFIDRINPREKLKLFLDLENIRRKKDKSSIPYPIYDESR